jgi:hypothetical protein
VEPAPFRYQGKSITIIPRKDKRYSTKIKGSLGQKISRIESASSFSNEKRNSKRKSEKVIARKKMDLAHFSTSQNGKHRERRKQYEKMTERKGKAEEGYLEKLREAKTFSRKV